MPKVYDVTILRKFRKVTGLYRQRCASPDEAAALPQIRDDAIAQLQANGWPYDDAHSLLLQIFTTGKMPKNLRAIRWRVARRLWAEEVAEEQARFEADVEWAWENRIYG